MDISEGLYVLLLGLGTVFAGLGSIILIILALGYAFNPNKSRSVSKAADTKRQESAMSRIELDEPAHSHPGDDLFSGAERKQVVAAVSAAIAEYMGTDVSALRICSIRRVR
ncbi:MAG: OadG family transporter subunit [Clostridia bacterium]|nr:OadG family transporter subunit [Clostridia bacterium]